MNWKALITLEILLLILIASSGGTLQYILITLALSLFAGSIALSRLHTHVNFTPTLTRLRGCFNFISQNKTQTQRNELSKLNSQRVYYIPRNIHLAIGIDALGIILALAALSLVFPSWSPVQLVLFASALVIVTSGILLSFSASFKIGGWGSMIGGVFLLVPPLLTPIETGTVGLTLSLLSAASSLYAGFTLKKDGRRLIRLPIHPNTNAPEPYLAGDQESIFEAQENERWDHVLGFDFASFVHGIRAEDEYGRQLDLMRTEREEECIRRGEDIERAITAISKAHSNLVTPEKRSAFHVKKLVKELLCEWQLSDEVAVGKRVADTISKEYEQSVYRDLNELNKIDKMAVWEKIMEKCSYEIGRQLSMNRKDEQAIRFLKAATMLYPQDPDAHLMLGNSLGRLGRHDRALPHLKKAIKKRSDGSTNCLLGMTLGQLGRWFEAFPYLNTAQRMRGYAVDDYCLSICLAKLGRLSEAEQFIRQAVRKDPYQPEYRRLLGLILAARERQQHSYSWSPSGGIFNQEEKWRGD